MPSLLWSMKTCLPATWRAGFRSLLERTPWMRRLARVQWCPWRVGFVVGGTMKGGTTALNAFLGQHPEIQMPACKEAHYFDIDGHFPNDRPPDHALYHRHFSPTATTRLLGDATPIYMYWGAAAPRIMAYNPRMKWVLLLRQPVERAHSHWNMLRHQGLETLDFAEALQREPLRLANGPGDARTYSYLDRGRYATQLRRLFAVVPRKQVLVLRSEELRREHHATLRRVFAFLGVDPDLRTEPATIHAHEYKTPLPADLKRRLTARFYSEIRDLERLLHWDLCDWLQ